MMGGAIDWTELALVSRVEQFTADHPYFFIVSTVRLVRPGRSGTATGVAALRPRDSILSDRGPTGQFRVSDGSPVRPATASTRDRGLRPLVLPLRKSQATFPSMITVGRTDNNDLVVPDEQVSKFHAFFRVIGAKVELSDAGSRNGTFVNARKLPAKGEAASLGLRDRVSFGALEFNFFDAPGCWDFLHQLDRFG
jgi:hypothetical protein